MNDNTKLGFSILGGALVMGILTNSLLKVGPWGLNLLLCTIAFVVCVVLLARWQRISLADEGRWLLLPVLFFAASVAWRDSTTLKVFDVFAMLIALGLAAVRSRAGQVRVAGIADYMLALLFAGLNAAFGTVLLLFQDIRWSSLPRTGWLKHAGAVGRGVLIAVPLLLLFGGLFMAADAAFEHAVQHLFRFDADAIIENVLVIGFATWITAGTLRRLFQSEEMVKTGSVPTWKRPSLGIVELGMTLCLLDVLFLSFVCVQLRYFFGGQAHVLAIPGLTAADYARRGFFELVTVATLALPLLLLADWLHRKETLQTERLFRAFAGIMIVLLFVIMGSAVQRMALYHIGYGLTELRFYTTVFMGWLALVFLWFAYTVLRGQRERFIFGAMVTGFAVLLFLHILNPDALIVRANVARIRAGRTFDAGYATQLSADAVPELLRAMPRLTPDERVQIAESLTATYSYLKMDWRTWSFSLGEAHRAVNRSLR